ncbi:hypothetical protein A2U01_0067959 [Trifolium medium]|uniref:Uncharacterized protein n=1 Tax=Trifolium medium TaxID=97028 RepID=A0A392SCX0_9FABA|nr:hypothetical protein [Trifolium medium]
MVHGRTISFNRNAINDYLGNPYELEADDQLCPYSIQLAKGNWDIQAMTGALLIPGRTFKFNTNVQAFDGAFLQVHRVVIK